MTQLDFGTEIQRLYRGFRADNDLTPERLQALYDGLGHHPLGAIKDAISRALREPRMPGYDQLHRYADEAAESDRKLDLAQERQTLDRHGFVFCDPSRVHDIPERPGWAASHCEAAQRIFAGDLDGAIEILDAIGSPSADAIRAQRARACAP